MVSHGVVELGGGVVTVIFGQVWVATLEPDGTNLGSRPHDAPRRRTRSLTLSFTRSLWCHGFAPFRRMQTHCKALR